MLLARFLRFNDERHRIDAKAGSAELEPIAHDALNLG